MKSFLFLVTMFLIGPVFADATGNYQCVVQRNVNDSGEIILGKLLSKDEIASMRAKAAQSITGAPEVLNIGSHEGTNYSIEIYYSTVALLVVKNGQEMRLHSNDMGAVYSVKSKDDSGKTVETSFSCLQEVLE